MNATNDTISVLLELHYTALLMPVAPLLQSRLWTVVFKEHQLLRIYCPSSLAIEKRREHSYFNSFIHSVSCSLKLRKFSTDIVNYQRHIKMKTLLRLTL